MDSPRGAQAGTEKIPQWMKTPSCGRRYQCGQARPATALKSTIGSPSQNGQLVVLALLGASSKAGFGRRIGAMRRSAMAMAAWVGALASSVPAPLPAQPVAAQEADRQALAQGLQAQYEVALIRDRKLADDRETQEIGALEARLRAARAQADAARGDARQADAALASARTDYVTLAAQVVQHDPPAQAEVAGLHAEAQAVAAKASPAKAAA